MLSNSLINDAFSSIGMHFSTRCADETPFTTKEAIAARIEAGSLFARLQDPEGTYAQDAIDTCALWDVQPSPPVENEPVRSDIPTLVLAGEFDPITPPSAGMAVAANLSNATFIEFPAVGHGLILEGECAASIINAFLDGEDAPDTSCISEEFSSPAWVTPVGAITLAPADSPFGVRIVEPEGWDSIEEFPGRFYRHEIAGPVLIQTVVPGATVEQFMEQQLLNIPGVEPEELDPVSAGGLTWRVVPAGDRREAAGDSGGPGAAWFRRHRRAARGSDRLPVPAGHTARYPAAPDAGSVRFLAARATPATGRSAASARPPRWGRAGSRASGSW